MMVFFVFLNKETNGGKHQIISQVFIKNLSSFLLKFFQNLCVAMDTLSTYLSIRSSRMMDRVFSVMYQYMPWVFDFCSPPNQFIFGRFLWGSEAQDIKEILGLRWPSTDVDASAKKDC